jgi:hypothetical protein
LGTRINFQRGDSRAKLRRVWANPVRGGARVGEPSDVVVSADNEVLIDDGSVNFEFNLPPLDEDKCGQDGTKATMGIVVKNNRPPKKRS